MWKSISVKSESDIHNINEVGKNSEEIVIANIMDELDYEWDIIISWFWKLKKLEISSFTYFGWNIIISDNPSLEKIIIKWGSADSITVSNNPKLKEIDFNLMEEYFEQSLIYSVYKEKLFINNNNSELNIILSECEKYYYFWNEKNYKFTIRKNTPEQLHSLLEWFEWNWSSSEMIPVLESFIYNSKIDKINLLYLYEMWTWGAGSWGMKKNENEDFNNYGDIYNFLLKIEELIENWKYASFTPELTDEYPFEHWYRIEGIPSVMKKHSWAPDNLISSESIWDELKEENLGSHWTYTKTIDSVYMDGMLLEWADATTFEIVNENQWYTKDKNNVYFDWDIIKWANSASFDSVQWPFFKDDWKIYFEWKDVTSKYSDIQLAIRKMLKRK